MQANTEKRTHHLRVPVQADEAREILTLAKAAGLPVAAYLRQVGMGCRLQPVVDHARITELATVSADLARLGKALKLWLQDDARTRQFGEPTIRAVLARVDETQGLMLGLLRVIASSPKRRRF